MFKRRGLLLLLLMGLGNGMRKTARSPLPRNISVSVSTVHAFDKELEEKEKQIKQHRKCQENQHKDL